MQWVEIINARIASSTGPSEVKRLFSDIRDNVTTNAEERVRVVIYQGNTLKSDWAVHLHRNTENRPPGRTGLGIKLADEIRQIALVDHSVWLEET